MNEKTEQGPTKWSDGVTLERGRRGDLVIEQRNFHHEKIIQTGQRAMPPIEYYYRRKTVSASEYYAGLQMMDLYRFAGYVPSFGQPAYTKLVQSHGDGATGDREDLDLKLDAGGKLHKAEAILQPVELWIIRKLCGYEEYPETKGKNLPLRVKKAMWQGLRALGVHFKIPVDQG